MPDDHVPHHNPRRYAGARTCSYVSSRRSNARNDQTSALSLLPGDIKYESPGGGFTFSFPITTSIVVSIILTLVPYLLR